MAYYPPEFVERIRLIKKLQEERFMPLKVIREEILEKAIDAAGDVRVSRRGPAPLRRARQRAAAPGRDRRPDPGQPRGYDRNDVEIIEALARFRAGGYDESLGFTVYDTDRYREALQPLVEEEVEVALSRLAGLGPERAVEIIAAGAAAARSDRRDAPAAARPAAARAQMSTGSSTG